MRKWHYLDYVLLVPYLILSILGIIMVYSSSMDIGNQTGGSATSYLIKQVVYVIVGLVAAAFMSSISLRKIRQTQVLAITALVFIILLLFLLVFGQTVNGAAGWIHLGPISIQPAEFIKFYFIIWFANTIDNRQDEIPEFGWWPTFRQPIILAAIIVGLILVQPDTGGATINAAIIIVMLLASGIDWRWSGMILTGIVAAIIVVIGPVATWLSTVAAHTHMYQLQRFIAYVRPFQHANGSGAQLVNSYYALSNGGVFGVGLGNSIQKTGYLPEPNTDFIMAILAEELGLVTAIVVIMLIMIIIARMVLIGIRSQSTYATLVCYGSATYLTVQTLFNIGGVLGMLPITGVTFPFISYGGSSTLTLALVMGLVLNISARQKLKRQVI
ncbi:FtsW/RodA/SpoVE family cell cycle protein [Levilactobacillus bambusae]|uniref:Probable peptidoglycan glycosyltransferase FtsW n=1 Tax=Levilactobacillus bambusae TaxID=2024736 RepID=A0A2V1N0R9_9LACO|nr:FtsW/RodA/SpoVE family cell cycle protein [Levilactobacillus bambusae]PWG00672.1 cell division protein FtsW [Levilactobacillus bambusae]